MGLDVHLESTSFAKLGAGLHADLALRVSGLGGASSANNSWVTYKKRSIVSLQVHKHRDMNPMPLVG